MTKAVHNQVYNRFISIHMPHTWHDVLAHDVAESVGNFNPHATYVA